MATALAPLAVMPVGLAVAASLWAGSELGLPAIVVGALGIGAGALGTRGFHLDGLADTTDALASSYDRERALAVARTGDVGPAGVVALVLVLVIQCSAAGTVAASHHWGPLAVGGIWCLARVAASMSMTRGIPAARADGLGRTFAESVHPAATLALWLAVLAAFTALLALIGLDFRQALLTVAFAAAANGLLIRHVVRRLGGMVGDAAGAAIEITLAVLLAGTAA